jgi:putative Mn2+ efflux pump MntP
METLIASILLSLSTNIDNFAVGVAYSVRRVKINGIANVAIAILSGSSTFLSMSFGDWVEAFFSAAIAQQLGSGILIIMGLVTVAEFVKRKLNPVADQMPFGVTDSSLSFKDALGLGLALTITNLGTGIGAGMAQLNIVLTSSFSFLSSLLTIGGGFFLGNLIVARFSSNRLEFVSGILLISLGIYEWLMP